MVKLNWDYESGEGYIELSRSFIDADKVVKLDALVDWMAELQEIYNLMVTKNEQR